MSQNVTRPSRWLVLALLGAAMVAIAVPLALGRLSLVADEGRSGWAWSASEAWAAVVLGTLAGIFVALLLRPRWARLRVALGMGIALVMAGFGVWSATPGAALGIPGCGAAEPGAVGEWQLDARTVVDDEMRDSLSVTIEPIARTGRPLLADLLAELAATAIEDLGVDLLSGGSLPARHCRALVTGDQATGALPLLTNGAGAGGEALVPAELPVWRGNFDWWLAADGRLVGARFSIGGHPADAWAVDGLRGQLLVELWPSRMTSR